MQPRSRSLPDADLAALHSVIVVLEGELLGGALQPDLTQRLLQRLTQRGTLAEGSTPSNNVFSGP